MNECIYFVEYAPFHEGVCGNEKAPTYEFPVEPGCRCKYYKERVYPYGDRVYIKGVYLEGGDDDE